MIWLGAAAAFLAFAGATYAAARYGRRASVSIQADAHENPTGVLITARPSVRSVGIFRIRFDKDRGVVVKATEVYIDGAGDVQVNGRSRPNSDVFGNDSLVEGAEELLTTVLILMPKPTQSVIGWLVDLDVRARHRFLYYIVKIIPKARDRSYFWTDRVFVPRLMPPQEVVHS